MTKITKVAAVEEITKILARATEIETELAGVKPLNDEKETLKARMRQLAVDFPKLFETRTAQTVFADNGAVECTVTQGNTPVIMDFEGLRHTLDDEVFHQIFKITAADMNLQLWSEMVEHEVVKEADLKKHLSDGKQPTAAVSFKLKKVKGDVHATA